MIIIGADKELAIFCQGETTTVEPEAPKHKGYERPHSHSRGYYVDGKWHPYSSIADEDDYDGEYGNYNAYGGHNAGRYSGNRTWVGRDSSHSLSQLVLDGIVGVLKEGAEAEAKEALEKLRAGEGEHATDQDWNKKYYEGGTAGNASGGWVFDTMRKWLPSNGGCFYIDMGHVEMALPESSTPARYLAANEFMIALVRESLAKVNADRENKIQMGVYNSDMHGNSWGGHDNYGISKSCWQNILGNNLWMVCALASFQASASLLWGQGKVGVECGQPDPIDGFQMSTRADYLCKLTGTQTTADRPLLNLRDEPHGTTARLHVIFYDHTLMPYATYLRAGAMSLLLAMLERKYPMPQVLLDRPLIGAILFSRDTTFRQKMGTATGRELSVVDLQDIFCALAEDFVSRGLHEGLVDEASARLTIKMWRDAVDAFRGKDWLDKNSPRIDWVMKYRILRAATENAGREWLPDALNDLANYSSVVANGSDDPSIGEAMQWAAQMRKLDMQFHSLNSDNSIFCRLRNAGRIEEVLSADDMRAMSGADPLTRAWPRAELLRMAYKENIRPTVDWEDIAGSGYKLNLAHPYINPAKYQSAIGEAGSFKEAMINLGAEESTWRSVTNTITNTASSITGALTKKRKRKNYTPKEENADEGKET